jgi:hypothetical protein
LGALALEEATAVAVALPAALGSALGVPEANVEEAGLLGFVAGPVPVGTLDEMAATLDAANGALDVGEEEVAQLAPVQATPSGTEEEGSAEQPAPAPPNTNALITTVFLT